MKIIVLVFLSLLSINSVIAKQVSMEELLGKAKQLRQQKAKNSQSKENHFLGLPMAQQNLTIKQIHAILLTTKSRNTDLTEQVRVNTEQRDQLKLELRKKNDKLGELSTVLNNISDDWKKNFRESLVSTQIRGRIELLKGLANPKKVPSIEQLEKIWLMVLEEMTEAPKVVFYPAEVIVSVAGETKPQEIVRIGTFNLLSKGYYLHQPMANKVAELNYQPSDKDFLLANKFQKNRSGMAAVTLDLSQGKILSKQRKGIELESNFSSFVRDQASNSSEKSQWNQYDEPTQYFIIVLVVLMVFYGFVIIKDKLKRKSKLDRRKKRRKKRAKRKKEEAAFKKQRKNV